MLDCKDTDADKNVSNKQALDASSNIYKILIGLKLF